MEQINVKMCLVHNIYIYIYIYIHTSGFKGKHYKMVTTSDQHNSNRLYILDIKGAPFTNLPRYG